MAALRWEIASGGAARSPNEARARYRLGDALLEVAANSAALLSELENRYGDCAVRSGADGALPRVRCAVQVTLDGRLASVRFDPAQEIDTGGVALSLLAHPAADPLFVELQTAMDGLRVIVRAGTDIPVVIARGDETLVDCTQTPEGFLVDLIVNPVLAAQRELLFVHAASIGIGNAGVLLIGPSGSGKTTTALALAARGHAYFGDDMAAIRIASTELVALRSTANVRPGPHARALTHHLAAGRWDPPHADGISRQRLRVARLFPTSAAAPVRLRSALFLRRFAATPMVEPFTPTLDALGSSSRLALNNALWLAWGTTPQRRLLQFMLFVRMLTRARCAWLDVGTPEATADLIATTMEDAWD